MQTCHAHHGQACIPGMMCMQITLSHSMTAHCPQGSCSSSASPACPIYMQLMCSSADTSQAWWKWLRGGHTAPLPGALRSSDSSRPQLDHHIGPEQRRKRRAEGLSHRRHEDLVGPPRSTPPSPHDHDGQQGVPSLPASILPVGTAN